MHVVIFQSKKRGNLVNFDDLPGFFGGRNQEKGSDEK